ncbi:GTP-binding protein [Candidatus Woesearchaeota archaeon CG10_big_fil_rev_8_21_14_0_10_45_16]|nr:MAG: GTP-binding protein [Candidatus Woesearchaeota archaeon CG10_big_fil_rev_8_21_14_0_10_45_16]
MWQTPCRKLQSQIGDAARTETVTFHFPQNCSTHELIFSFKRQNSSSSTKKLNNKLHSSAYSKRGAKVKVFLKNLLQKFKFNPFARRGHIKLGLYGPPNGGKSTLANRVCQDWLGEEMSSVSHIAHETREIKIKEQINIKNKKGKELTFSLVDTPGIATKIDYEDFIKRGIKKVDAKKRAKEATKGVIDSIKWLDNMEAVVVVLDATMDPYSQVNITIIGNLQARNIPVLIAANKIDLKKSSIDVIKNAFPQYPVVGISAKYGKNIEDFYEQLFKLVK